LGAGTGTARGEEATGEQQADRPHSQRTGETHPISLPGLAVRRLGQT
jgi:hypothetical protein